MSKKVFFYMVLDLIGIGITLLIRNFLLGALGVVSISWVQSVLVLIVNLAAIAVCLFIIFFFLLYWWSDRKWTAIKNRFRKRVNKR